MKTSFMKRLFYNTALYDRSYASICLLYAIILQMPLYAQQQDPPVLDAREILQQMQSLNREKPPLAFEGEVAITLGHGAEQEKLNNIRQVSFYRRDGEKIDVKNLRYEFQDGIEQFKHESRGLWDGKLFIHRYHTAKSGIEKAVAYFERNLAQRNINMIYDSSTPFLDGYFYPDIEHYTAILQKSPNLKIRQDKLNGSNCYLLESDGAHGNYRVWVDPERGFNILKAIVRKDADDLMTTNLTVSQEGYKSAEFIVDNIELKKIDENWLPVAGTAKVRRPMINGGEWIVNYAARRTNITFHPDFDEMGAFKMDLPNGAYIKDLDFPGIYYEWWNGAPVLVVDTDITDTIQQNIKQLAEDNEIPPPPSKPPLGESLSETKNENLNISKPPPPISDAEIQTEKESPDNSQNWLIVIIILLFVLLAICCYFLWKNKYLKTKVEN